MERSSCSTLAPVYSAPPTCQCLIHTVERITHMSGYLNSNALLHPFHLELHCAMHFFLHCILKCRDVLGGLGRSSLADLSAALGRTRSSDSVRQMAPTAPSSFLPFSPQTIAIGNCRWKTTDRCLAFKISPRHMVLMGHGICDGLWVMGFSRLYV